MRSLADEMSPAGWPRPWLLWTPPADGVRAHAMPRILPVPWINGVHPYHGDWVTFDEARTVQAHDEDLCGICGQSLDRIALLGRAGEDATSGAGCHPRCMQLTLTGCPHFADFTQARGVDAIVGWRVDAPQRRHAASSQDQTAYASVRPLAAGLPGLTARDVSVLAAIDPWGTARREGMDANDTVSDG